MGKDLHEMRRLTSDVFCARHSTTCSFYKENNLEVVACHMNTSVTFSIRISCLICSKLNMTVVGWHGHQMCYSYINMHLTNSTTQGKFKWYRIKEES